MPQINDSMLKLVEATKELDTLKAKVKDLSKEVQLYMVNNNYTSLQVAGANLVLESSKRMTFKKNMKDQFIADMNTSGKSHLVSIQVDVNKDNLKTDLATGLIKVEDLTKYLSISETKSLKVDY